MPEAGTELLPASLESDPNFRRLTEVNLQKLQVHGR
jgi:hypothetical protein